MSNCDHIEHIRFGPLPEPEPTKAQIDAIVRGVRDILKEEEMPVRCKFVCSFKEGQSVHFSPVYSGSEENKKFFQATPGGQIAFYTVNQSALDQFEQGKEYYVDFTPAEKVAQGAGA